MKFIINIIRTYFYTALISVPYIHVRVSKKDHSNAVQDVTMYSKTPINWASLGKRIMLGKLRGSVNRGRI